MENKEQQQTADKEQKVTNADLLQWGWQSPFKQYQKYISLYTKLNNFYTKNPSVFSDYNKFKERFNYDTSNVQDQNLMDYFYNKYQSSKTPEVTHRTADENNNSLNLEIF